MATYQLSQELQQWSLLHFEKGVPICDIAIRKDAKDRLARVSHVYWQWKKNPFLDTKEMFRAMAKGKYSGTGAECNACSMDQALFEFVRDHVAPPSRAEATAKVRAVADKLMQNGMQTDNGKDMAEGAKILMKLDRLDQPESEQAELSKAAFLQPVVVTQVSQIDESKEDQTDEQSKLIMEKYGAYIDDKRTMIEERVATMEAAAGAEEIVSEE
jgi:hypothetical protein